MADFLKISNFGPVKEASLELKPYLVLIGGQGSGKSTLAKVLTICQDLSWYIDLLEGNGDPMQPFVKFNIAEYFNTYTHIEYHSNQLNLDIEYKDREFTISSTPLTHGQLLQVLKKARESVLSNFLKEAGIPIPGNMDELLKKDSSLLDSYTRFSLYIPAERNLAGAFSDSLASMMLANIPLPFTFLSYISLFEKAKKEYTTFKVPFINITFEQKDKREGVIVTDGDSERLLPLSMCSSGIQSVLPLLMILNYCIEKHYFSAYVIEEPEQNLFPDNQLGLLRFIIEKVKQVKHPQSHTITTHSPYLLSGINLSLLAGRIVQNHPEMEKQVNEILPQSYWLAPDEVAAYSLGQEDEYCKNIINTTTGTIDQNYLDTTSDIVGQEFNRLYKLFVESLKKN